MAVSREQVFQAANDLDRKGQKPTLAAVRKSIGSGSFSTISEHLAEWKTQRAAIAPSEPAPQPIADRVRGLADEIWSHALTEAQQRFSLERSLLESDRVQREAAINETLVLVDQYAAELDVANSKNQALELSLSESNDEMESLRVRLATAEATAAEREKLIEAIGAELNRLNAQNRDLVLALTEAAVGREMPLQQYSGTGTNGDTVQVILGVPPT